jgi:hypothetical protein
VTEPNNPADNGSWDVPNDIPPRPPSPSGVQQSSNITPPPQPVYDGWEGPGQVNGDAGDWTPVNPGSGGSKWGPSGSGGAGW